MRSHLTQLSGLVLVSLGTWSCGDKPSVGSEEDPLSTTNNTGENSDGDAGPPEPLNPGADDDGADDDLVVPAEGPGDETQEVVDVGPAEDACAAVDCAEHQSCSAESGTAACVPNTCDELQCDQSSVCVEVDGGAYCRDLTCSEDVDCEETEHCADGLCAEDACTPNEQRCDGDTLRRCLSNGSAEVESYTCSSGSPYFDSSCQATDGSSDAGCACEDDWDCPTHTRCELGRCIGTGIEPSCTLPPPPFSADDTRVEISWGGTDENSKQAVDSPYPAFSQVVMTPVVANLDDDNQDGLINSQDVPEIVFLSFTGSNFTKNGVLRAIHGGTTYRLEGGVPVPVKNQGDDFFAVCNAESGDRWLSGVGYEGDAQCLAEEPVHDSTSSLAVGDLDYDGVPEIVAMKEQNDNGVTQVFIYSNLGQLIAKSDSFNVTNSSDQQRGPNPAPSIANVDGQGHAEIIVGRWVFQLKTVDVDDTSTILAFSHRFQGTATNGANRQGPTTCVANIIDDGDGAVQEIVAGTAAYSLPTPPEPLPASQADCEGTDWCEQRLVLRWDASTVNDSLPSQNGFCAVADVLGVDVMAQPSPANPLDGKPEVVVMSNGKVLILNGETGELLRTLTSKAMGSGGGGAPNIDDFDGDGFPEIGAAGETGYAVHDLQAPTESCPWWSEFSDREDASLMRTPPGLSCNTNADCGDETQFVCNERLNSCVCLQNGWLQRSQDASSKVTGSSVFDFNGDGAAEVIYNDECRFRVYDGTSGDVLIEEWSESRTRIEYPIVADVDRDGNAEIVFSTSNESGYCSARGTPDAPREQFNNGIEVWGDQRDLWVPARAIWNQHAYHVTNITEDGQVPVNEPESWRSLNGRLYNTYRSNPRNFGVAPDLVVKAIQVTSPGVGCGKLGTALDLVIEVENQGDLLVGGEVLVGVYGSWDGTFEALLDAGGDPIQVPLGTALDAKQSLLLRVVGYQPAHNGKDRLPDEIKVVIDDTALQTECIEDNNERVVEVKDGENLPDLRLVLSSNSVLICPSGQLVVTVHNDGSLAVDSAVVAFYAGDPIQGGREIHRETIAGPIEPGGSVTQAVTVPISRALTLFAVVDPDDSVTECDDGNNGATGPNAICGPGPIR